MNIPLPVFVTNWINRNKKLWLIAAYAAVIADLESINDTNNVAAEVRTQRNLHDEYLSRQSALHYVQKTFDRLKEYINE